MPRLRFALLGAALVYFFDPDNGSRRRAQLRERLASLHTDEAPRELDDELVGQARDAG